MSIGHFMGGFLVAKLLTPRTVTEAEVEQNKCDHQWKIDNENKSHFCVEERKVCKECGKVKEVWY